ncbi:very short patch repair endonuclease [Variovorax paradoxus]|uniref:very short patch repair endonuclease n=1 Tax=Variovorax paradoxus TaxID=34073 RepID=UPI0021AC513F|nr:very short patch repair endonuclease [Variovorax paradoxus]UVH59381.1 very short patch repair endonuclease [Variovorax paradoxus]
MDSLTPLQRSERMRKVRATDTALEMVVRRLVHGMGYRYRLHRKDLPGKPDLVFPARHKVIFIHGCFWHRHDDPDCRLARLPKSRLEFWIPKLDSNKARDVKTLEILESMGWNVMTIWECQIRDTKELERRIREFLDP